MAKIIETATARADRIARGVTYDGKGRGQFIYWPNKNHPKIALPGKPGDEAFEAAYPIAERASRLWVQKVQRIAASIA